jgi:hypothetical protein
MLANTENQFAFPLLLYLFQVRLDSVIYNYFFQHLTSVCYIITKEMHDA